MDIQQNSLRAWLLAARPKTLTAAAVPVIIAVSMAAGCGVRWLPAVLCLLFAWVMQIDSNLVNDYFDFVRGNDDETRLGPKRACAEGWVTLRAMRIAIAATTLAGCALGLPLVLWGGGQMVLVGAACVVFCFLYTTTLSYHGMGDVLVLLFFGVVPVCCTFFLVTPEGTGMPWQVVTASVACGLVVDTLLVVNNYRDHDNDLRAGKRTLVVRIGRQNSELLYLLLGIVPAVVMMTLQANLLLLVYVYMHTTTWRRMKQIARGSALNYILGATARNIFLFGLLNTTQIFHSLW